MQEGISDAAASFTKNIDGDNKKGGSDGAHANAAEVQPSPDDDEKESSATAPNESSSAHAETSESTTKNSNSSIRQHRLSHETTGSSTLSAGAVSTSSSTGSHVSFGPVRVHTHRMTLGTNPSTRTGVPVELAWQYDESLDFSNLDGFEEHVSSETQQQNLYRGGGSSDARRVHRIAAASRERIAELHHSRDSIVRVEHEVKEIQKSRTQSEHDRVVERRKWFSVVSRRETQSMPAPSNKKWLPRFFARK